MNLRMLTSTVTLVVMLLALSASISEGKPYAYSRWFDYDDFPSAKPAQTSEGTVHMVPGSVNPLRPYEPWILECIVFPSDKVEPGKRHERCQLLDESNEKEYARYLQHVKQWEEAYPERAARWNERFPEAKANEKKKYEQLKVYAEMHRKSAEESDIDSEEDPDSDMMGEDSSASTESNKSVKCPTTTIKCASSSTSTSTSASSSMEVEDKKSR